MCQFLKCNALFCCGGGPTFGCICEGVCGAAAAFDGPIFGCVFGWCIEGIKSGYARGKWQVLPYSACSIFYVE